MQQRAEQTRTSVFIDHSTTGREKETHTQREKDRDKQIKKRKKLREKKRTEKPNLIQLK